MNIAKILDKHFEADYPDGYTNFHDAEVEIKNLMLNLTEFTKGMNSPEATIAIIQKRIEDL